MITLNVHRICEDGKIGVTIDVTYSSILPPEIFLFRSEDDAPMGVASLPGVVKDWPAFKDIGKCFYRASSVTKYFDTLDQNETFISDTEGYITTLQSDYSKYLEDNLYGQDQTVEI